MIGSIAASYPPCDKFTTSAERMSFHRGRSEKDHYTEWSLLYNAPQNSTRGRLQLNDRAKRLSLNRDNSTITRRLEQFSSAQPTMNYSMNAVYRARAKSGFQLSSDSVGDAEKSIETQEEYISDLKDVQSTRQNSTRPTPIELHRSLEHHAYLYCSQQHRLGPFGCSFALGSLI